ncbi:MAG: leucine-rich repeat protein, partial [Lachnospiraceae bacterium]|nr:leucine-rich repeat protein [Lachnospiraceae bacterium]
KNVRFIGREAFAGIVVKTFEVDEDNPWFSAKDGALLSKAGDSLFAFATNKQKSYVVPDGVRDLDIGILEEYGEYDRLDDDRPCRIYLPESVIRITGRTIFTSDLVFHCPEGSFAESYAEKEGIAVSHDLQPVTETVRIETEKGTLSFLLNASHATLVKYEGTDEAIELPAEVSGKPLTVIGDGLKPVAEAAADGTARRIVFPDTVEVIAAHAFEKFGILDAALPKHLKVLGDFAFDYCTIPISELPEELVDLGEQSLGFGAVFPYGVTIPASLQRVAPGAFSGVPVLEFRLGEGQDGFMVRNGMLYSDDGSILLAANAPDKYGHIVIPDGTKYIGSRSFSAMPLTKIEIPSSVEVIAQYAFAYCTMLTEVTFHEGLKNVGSYSFMYSGVKEIDLPESCFRIGTAAFFGCTSLEKASFSASTVGPYAFGYGRSLDSVVLREGVEEIGAYAFFETVFGKITLPDSLCVIGEEAFGNESGIVRPGDPFTLRIGKNVSSIGKAAFGNLPVSAFNVDPGNAAFSSVDAWLSDRSGKRILFSPAALGGNFVLPYGVEEIADRAFSYASALQELTIPASVAYIGPNAFRVFRAKDTDLLIAVLLHVKTGSQAHRFTIENGWPYVDAAGQ